MEWIDLGRVALVPVVAPGFLPFPATTELTPQRMQALTGCVVRDSARDPVEAGHFLVEGAPRCSVPDHLMKKELILHGMAWGHLPRFPVEAELRDGRLLSIAGQRFPGVVEELSAARRRDRPHGPVVDRLAEFLAEHAPVLGPALGGFRGRGGVRPLFTNRDGASTGEGCGSLPGSPVGDIGCG